MEERPSALNERDLSSLYPLAARTRPGGISAHTTPMGEQNPGWRRRAHINVALSVSDSEAPHGSKRTSQTARGSLLGSACSSGFSTPHATGRHASRRSPVYTCPQSELLPGIVFENGSRKIARLMRLSAAQLQGILAEGDEIVEVNGRPCDSEQLRQALKCTGNLFGSSVLITVARRSPNEHSTDYFSTRLLLAPAHEVLAKDQLWQSLQELSFPESSAAAANASAGVGLVLGMDARGEPYVERFVEKSPAELCGVIERHDVLYSIDGFVVGGKRPDYISNLLTGEEGSACHLMLLRGAERNSIQVTLKRALPAGVQRRPTIKDVAAQFENMERRRLTETTQFMHNFGAWHREVNRYLESTVRGLHEETNGTSPKGKLNITVNSLNSSRGQLQDAIHLESLCEQVLRSHNQKLLQPLVEFWVHWTWQRRRLHLLSTRLDALLRRNQRASFFCRLYENCTARRLYRRKLSKAIVYGRIAQAKSGFAGLANYQQQMYERRQEGKRIASILVRVSLSMSRSKRIRNLRSWWEVAMRTKSQQRNASILAQKSGRRLMFSTLQAWWWLKQIRKQTISKGIWLLTKFNHGLMDMALQHLAGHMLLRRKARSISRRYATARAFAGLKIVTEGLEKTSIAEQHSIFSTTGRIGTPMHGEHRRKSSIRAWVGKSLLKEKLEVCGRAFAHWHARQRFSLQRFVCMNRFQGRCMSNYMVRLLAGWLLYKRREKVLRQTYIKFAKHDHRSSLSCAFQRNACAHTHPIRTYMYGNPTPPWLDINATIVIDKHEDETVNRLTRVQGKAIVSSWRARSAYDVYRMCSYTEKWVSATRRRTFREWADSFFERNEASRNASKDATRRLDVAQLKCELDLCREDLANCRSDLEVARRLHLDLVLFKSSNETEAKADEPGLECVVERAPQENEQQQDENIPAHQQARMAQRAAAPPPRGQLELRQVPPQKLQPYSVKSEKETAAVLSSPAPTQRLPTDIVSDSLQTYLVDFRARSDRFQSELMQSIPLRASGSQLPVDKGVDI